MLHLGKPSLTLEMTKLPAKNLKKGSQAFRNRVKFSTAAVMKSIEKMQVESLSWLQALAATVNTNSIKSVTDALKLLGKQVDDVFAKVKTLQSKVEMLERENKVHHDDDDLDLFKKRWNLHVAGIQEQHGENNKKTLVELLSQVSPNIADWLLYSVDRYNYYFFSLLWYIWNLYFPN